MKRGYVLHAARTHAGQAPLEVASSCPTRGNELATHAWLRAEVAGSRASLGGPRPKPSTQAQATPSSQSPQDILIKQVCAAAGPLVHQAGLLAAYIPHALC